MEFKDIDLVDSDGHIIESIAELAEFGDASVKNVALDRKSIRRLYGHRLMEYMSTTTHDSKPIIKKTGNTPVKPAPVRLKIGKGY